MRTLIQNALATRAARAGRSVADGTGCVVVSVGHRYRGFFVLPSLQELGLRFLRTVVALADVLLLFGSALVLLWFIYRIYLRRIWRARRIANLRMKRLLEERNGEGDGGDSK